MTVRIQRAKGPSATTTTGLGADRLPAYHTIHYEIDMANVALDVTAGTFVSADQYVAIALPAFTELKALQAICVTALSLGAGAAISIGDTGSGTRFVNGASTLTAGTVLTQAVTTNPLKFYSVGDQLLISITGATIATGVLRLIIVVGDMTRNQDMTVQN